MILYQHVGSVWPGLNVDSQEFNPHPCFTSPSSIPSNLRALVYSIGVREGGEVEWNQVFCKYSTTHIASERRILLDALTYTRDPYLVQR
mgnify:CR=1 FL=1